MYRLKEIPPVRALDFIGSPPRTFRAAQSDQTDSLAVRAAIFQTIDDVPHLLVLRRSEGDSLPGCWELPGGGVEDDDPSIKDALYREIKEETGLTGAWIVQEVGHGERWQKVKQGKNVHYLCVTFVVEAEEIEMLERGITKGSKDGDVFRTIPTTDQGPTSSASEGGQVPIKLSSAEHQDYLWITDEELMAQKSGGHELAKFPSEAMRLVMLESFKVQAKVIAAKKTI